MSYLVAVITLFFSYHFAIRGFQLNLLFVYTEYVTREETHLFDCGVQNIKFFLKTKNMH